MLLTLNNTTDDNRRSSPASISRSPIRAHGLDVLRGLAILGMVFSSLVPRNANLPAWMFHAQSPPPLYTHDPTAMGITWVDLVFPIFLFAMGASVPLAHHNRIELGFTRWRIFRQTLWRYLLLLFFALFVGHTLPYPLIETYGTGAWAIALGAFVCMFGIFCRWPKQMPTTLSHWTRIISVAVAIAILYLIRYPNETGFSLQRHDIILILIANAALATTIIGLLIPGSWTLPIVLLIMGAVVHLARPHLPILQNILDLTFLGEQVKSWITWAFQPAYLCYLWITLPGMMAGNVMVAWMRPARSEVTRRIRRSGWRTLGLVRCVVLAIGSLFAIPMVTTALYLRDPWLAASMAALALSPAIVFVYSPPSRNEWKSGAGRTDSTPFRYWLAMGVILVMAGIVLELYHEEVRKDPVTPSYLLITAGLSTLLLIATTLITEVLLKKANWKWLSLTGENPMVAYVASSFVILPILQLINWDNKTLSSRIVEWIGPGWPGLAWPVIITAGAALIAATLSRLRIYWRT